MDVLIVGAGSGGLALANSLAAHGASFRVIDPLSEPVRDSRAHGFGARTLAALDTLGLAAPMMAAAKQPPPILREYFGGKLVSAIDFSKVQRDPYPTMLAIFQQRVVRVLESALQSRNSCVEWSTRLVGFRTDAKGVTADVDRGGEPDTIRANWIVGCDGGHSTVRKSLGLDSGREASELRVMLTECDIDWTLSRDIWWTWHDMGGFAGAIYNDFTNKWHVSVLDLRDDEPSLDRVADLLRKRSRVGSVGLRNPAWIRALTASQRVADHFLVGRAALVGDAAHVFSAVAGQGLHFAIEDGLNLGWKLGLVIAGAASPTLLETYDQERRERAENAIRKTRTAGRVLGLRGVGGKALWAALYVMGKRFRSIASIASNQAERLETDYKHSPLSHPDRSNRLKRAPVGRYPPDGACRQGGLPTHLYAIIRGPQANLLFFVGLSPSATSVGAFKAIAQSLVSLTAHLCIHYVFGSQAHATEAGFSEDDRALVVDGLEALHMAFDIDKPEMIYLRPDGYIGLRSEDLEGNSLRAYLRRIYAAGLEQDR